MARILPKEVADQKIEAFKKLKEKYGHLKQLPHGSAQFTYKGTTYTIKKNSTTASGFQVVPAWREARDAASRRGNAKKQKVKLSSIEQMMTDNYYKDAKERGLVVDHDIPINRGGPSNHPAYLNLMTPEENSRKGDKIGGHYKTESLTTTKQNGNGAVNGNGADAVVPNGNGLSNGVPSNGKAAHVIVDSARGVVTTKPAKSFVEIMAMLAKGLA
jgi:hypothetical protein